jgi:glycosyltransferase involved in cell wall biosynthesis
MKIVQVTPEFPPNCGGIGYYVFYLSKELIKMGYEILVVLRGKDNRSYCHGQIRVRSVKVGGRSPLNLPVFSKKIGRVLLEEKADLVHIHSTVMPTLNSNCPIMVTAHWCNKEGIPLFHRPIRNLDALYRNLMFPIYTIIESNLVKSCKKLTVVSNSLRKEFENHYGTTAEVVYNAVDTELFNVNSQSRRDNAILFAGKLCIGKGIVDLLEIAELLNKSHPETKLYIIGKGPLKRHIKKSIRNRHLTNVSMLDSIGHSELIKYYHITQALVLPTYYEGLPNVVLEAMACELPVIASKVSGIPEQVEDNVTGFLVPPGDIQCFYKKIVELLESPDKRNILGKNARKKVLENFTWNLVAKRIADNYQQILEKHLH